MNEYKDTLDSYIKHLQDIFSRALVVPKEFLGFKKPNYLKNKVAKIRKLIEK